MSVHYKFKSNLDHDTVTFDGLSISVADLKKSIMHQKKIGKSSDFDLQITNAQTKEVYDNDETLVPKNTSVIVARVPVASGNKKNWDKPELPLPIDDDDLGQIRYDKIVKSADLANSNVSEEDKVKAMITQSSQEYDPSKYVKSRSMTGPLPPTYTCFRCGKTGHWIKNCPTNNPDVKRSTGIPRSFMVPVDGPEHRGALLTSSGEFAVPLIDHQAYKEVKKEKPPFVPQEETAVEPDAQIPEELLCMVCRDLLQDAVLIPCCGNSFCDECVRQVLLESDNHECPLCHETEISPDTVIPNRFLRTAVLNFRNETGYTRVKRISIDAAPPPIEHRVDSPQPSPDSTVESHPVGECAVESSENFEENKDIKNEPVAVEELSVKVKEEERESIKEEDTDAEGETTQPGTPLADEPPDDMTSQPLPIQTIGQEKYHNDRYEYQGSSKYSRSHRDYGLEYRDEQVSSSEPRPISTIETITNIRNKGKFVGRPAPVRQHFPNQRPNRDDRPDGYIHDRDDYNSRYDRRHHADRRDPRVMHHSRYDRSNRESRYHHDNRDYIHNHEPHHDGHYEARMHLKESQRHSDRFTPPKHSTHVPPVPNVYAASSVAVPQPGVITTTQVFPAQPPPPGASPTDTSHMPMQPPPPGIGPLLPTSLSGDPAQSYGNHIYDADDALKEGSKVDDRSINDKLEAFQRELEKRDRAYPRDVSRSRSRSNEHSRSTSRSRSYSSSKSWTRSHSRSTSRSSRSRSRTPISSRSRSRSYSRSRSRSWSKPRSYTRSRSRSRTGSSRSRSRSRTESRSRTDSRSRRVHSPRHRSRSRSFTPKDYRPQGHRIPYQGKSFNPPQYGGSYQSHYPPQPILPMPVIRPPAYQPHHLHSMHSMPQPVHQRPIEHYPMDRPPRYSQAYSDQYPVYDMYPQKVYPNQRYDQRERDHRYDPRMVRGDRRQDYQRDEVPHRIPGWVGDRNRDYRPRYRHPREPHHKEIKELPKVPEIEMRVAHDKEVREATPLAKKREEKPPSKHKKHHHRSKELKKKEKLEKIPVSVNTEKIPEETRIPELEKPIENKNPPEVIAKVPKAEKAKEKKHKHKKHKSGEQTGKKKKKEKHEVAMSTDSEVPVVKKSKKKKNRLKSTDSKSQDSTSVDQEKIEVPEVKIIETPVESIQVEETKPEPVPEEKPELVPEYAADTLDIFADDEMVDSTKDAPAEPEITTEVESTMVEEMAEATENMESEGEVEDENVLHVDVPALSKWEREEIEDDFTMKPQRRSAVVVPKEENKAALSSDIIQRAENVILSKPLKTAILSTSKYSDRRSPDASLKHKEPEIKSVVNSNRNENEPVSSSLQVTISSSKEKRSVRSTKEDAAKRSDRSKPKPDLIRPKSSSRTVVVESNRDSGSRSRKRTSQDRDTSRNTSRDRTRHAEKEVRHPHRKHDEYTKRKPEIERYIDVKAIPRVLRTSTKRSRSPSNSSDSRSSHLKRQHTEKHLENKKQPKPVESSLQCKHSPIKAPKSESDHSKIQRKEYDDFEPDYDAYSEEETTTKPKPKHATIAVEPSKKSSKHEELIKPRVKSSSSSSSSVASGSDSSDSDTHKGTRSTDTDHKQKHRKSRHKKHKKHKRKHKKKKSHRVKKE